MKQRYLLFLTLSIGACGAMPHSKISQSPAQSADARPLSPSDSIRQEISRHFQEIGRLRQQAGLPREPETAQIESATATPNERIPMATPPVSNRSVSCQDTCTLQASICENATSICSLAQQLDNDAWANEKCDSGKASCTLATEKCDECSPSSPPSTTEEEAAPSP